MIKEIKVIPLNKTAEEFILKEYNRKPTWRDGILINIFEKLNCKKFMEGKNLIFQFGNKEISDRLDKEKCNKIFLKGMLNLKEGEDFTVEYK